MENFFQSEKTEEIEVIQHHVTSDNLRIMVQPQVAFTDENEYETDSDSDSVVELSGDDDYDVVPVTRGDIDSSEGNDEDEFIFNNEC